MILQMVKGRMEYQLGVLSTPLLKQTIGLVLADYYILVMYLHSHKSRRVGTLSLNLLNHLLVSFSLKVPYLYPQRLVCWMFTPATS